MRALSGACGMHLHICMYLAGSCNLMCVLHLDRLSPRPHPAGMTFPERQRAADALYSPARNTHYIRRVLVDPGRVGGYTTSVEHDSLLECGKA